MTKIFYEMDINLELSNSQIEMEIVTFLIVFNLELFIINHEYSS